MTQANTLGQALRRCSRLFAYTCGGWSQSDRPVFAASSCRLAGEDNCSQLAQAFAVTHEGDLLALALEPAATREGCQIRHRKALGPAMRAAALSAVRGYALVAAPEGAGAYNITSTVASLGPQEVVAASLAAIAQECGLQQASSFDACPY